MWRSLTPFELEIGEEKAVELRSMPTLATMKLSRRWGTRFCGGSRMWLALVGFLYYCAALYYGVYVFEEFDVLEGVGG